MAVQPSQIDRTNLIKQWPKQFDELSSALGIKVTDESTVEKQTAICFTATVEACKQSHWAVIKKVENLLPSLFALHGKNALQGLIEEGGSLGCIESILDNAVNRTLLSNGSMNTLLHLAVRKEREDKESLLEVLLQYGGIDREDAEGKTPLHVAVEGGDEKAVNFLLNRGASRAKCFINDGMALTPAAYAIAKGEIGCFTKIITDKSWKLEDNSTMLHVAVRYRQNEVLNQLLKNFSEHTQLLLKEKDTLGNTPFLLAAFLGDDAALKSLYDAGADIKVADNKGNSALHLAASGGHRKVISLLMYFRADVNQLNRNHETARELAKDPTIKDLILNLSKADSQVCNFSLKPPLNLVIKGGGPLGIAEVGAIEELESKDALRELQRIAGTSAGAINGVLLAVGYSGKQIEKFAKETPLTKLLDHPFTEENIERLIDKNLTIKNLLNIRSQIKKILNPLEILKLLWSTTGICEGKFALEWLEEKISQATGIKFCTFKDLRKKIHEDKKFKHLHVFATRIGNNPEISHFSSEDTKWDALIISDAVRCSMSIPGIFKPHGLYFKDEEGRRSLQSQRGSYVDGGLVLNFPLDIFDFKKYLESDLPKDEGNYTQFNPRTLGLSLYSKMQEVEENNQIENVGQLLMGVIRTYYKAESLLFQLKECNKSRVINIDNLGFGLLDFNMSSEDQDKLIKSGREAVQEFMPEEQVSSFGSMFQTGPSVRSATTLDLKPQLPSFKGRQEILNQMKETLLKKGDNTNKCAIYGEQGIGKKELACHFAHKHQKEFSFIAWIDGQTPDYSLMKLGKEWGLKNTQEVIDHLENHPFKKPWFLIFSEYPKKAVFPVKGGSVLYLADQQPEPEQIPKKNCYKVSSFSPNDALHFLEMGLEEQDPKYLAEALAFSPLALGMAKACIQSKKISLEDYLRQLPTQHTLKDLPFSFEKAVSLCFSLLKDQKDELVREWLYLTAYLGSFPIPLAWLDTWCTSSESAVPKQKEIICKELQDLGFHQLCGDRLYVHPLVKRFIQIKLENEKPQQYYRKAFALLEKVSSSEEYFLHSQELLKHSLSKKLDPFNRAQALQKIGTTFLSCGAFSDAEDSFNKVLVLAEKSTHPNRTFVITNGYHHLGMVYQGLKDYSLAIKNHKTALERRKDRHIGVPHADTAESYEHLGIALMSNKEVTEACKFFQEALLMKRKLYQMPEEQPKLVSCLIHSGVAKLKLRDNSAERDFQEAHRIMQKFPNDYTEELAHSWLHLGVSCLVSKKFTDASNYLQEALKLFTKNEKRYAREIAICSQKIGKALLPQNKDELALKAFKKALTLRELLNDSEGIARSLFGIALYFKKLANYDEALKYLNKALSKFKEFDPNPVHFELKINKQRQEIIDAQKSCTIL